MIGTDIGNVHNLQQGQGLATVVNQNALLDDALYRKKFALAEKQRKKQEAISDFDSFDPQFFYADNKEKETIVNDVQSEFIRLQEKGVENPFKATDPESKALQQRAKKGLMIGEVSKKKEEKYFEFAKILSDPEKAKQIKNADEIKQWFFETSPTKIVDEKLEFPEIQFKEPAFNTLGKTSELSKSWIDMNKRTMSSDEADSYAGQILADPSYNEPDGYVQAMKQTYFELMPEDQKKYRAKAIRLGDGSLETQVKFFMSDQIRDASGHRIDLGAKIAEDAGKTNVSVSGNEKGDAWTYVKGGEDDYIKKRTTSILKSNIGQIERDVEQGLYGDIDDTPQENFEAAYKYYSDIYKTNIERRFNPANTSGGGGADAEAEEGFNRWLYNLTQGDEFEKKDAATFTFGSGDPKEGGVIADANVYTPEEVSKALEGKYPKQRVGGVIKEPPKLKNRYLVVNVKDKAKLTDLQESNFAYKYGEEALEGLKEMTGKGDVVVYELDEKNTQALRKIYKNSATSQGGNYKPTVQSGESYYNFDE